MDLNSDTRRAIWAHVLPFLAWVAIMSVPWGSPAWRYAIQSAATTVLLFVLRPWRHHARVNLRQWPLAFVVGTGVCLVWVVPETPWMFQFSHLHDLYLKYGIRPLGVITGYEAVSPYAPEQCGWALALVRLLGSALVIAAAEEFFWRGFIYRWLVARESFLTLDPTRLNRAMFVATALLFGMEHDRWLVGVLAGLAYGWLYVRTGNIWTAVFAHAITNFLIGLYVLATASYYFW